MLCDLHDLALQDESHVDGGVSARLSSPLQRSRANRKDFLKDRFRWRIQAAEKMPRRVSGSYFPLRRQRTNETLRRQSHQTVECSEGQWPLTLAESPSVADSPPALN